MRRGTSWALLFAIVGAILVGPASGAQEPFAELEGVAYYFAYGNLESSTLAVGTAQDGSPIIPFKGCLFAQLRPEMEHGVIRLIGMADNVTPIEITVNGFTGGSEGGIAMNIPVDSGLDSSAPTQPAAQADVAAWGTARLRVDGQNYLDPATDNNFTSATFFVTSQGFRDDATGAGGPATTEDWEVHMRLGTLPGVAALDETFTFVPTGDLPDGSLLPSETHGALFFFDNTRFGGTARVHVEAEANAPAGMNEIIVSVRGPTGLSVGNATLRPALQAPDVADMDFPLSEFGRYSISTRGSVALAKYTIDVTLVPPETLDLNLWWENVTLGAAAPRGYASCQQEVQRPGGSMAGAVVARAVPPPYDLATVIVGIAAASVAVILVVAILVHNATGSKVRKREGK